jgi:hypothetical protein
MTKFGDARIKRPTYPLTRATYPNHVYFAEGENGIVKIGYSLNPKPRVDVVSRTTSRKLTLRYSVEIPGPVRAKRLEACFHNYYAAQRLEGEYFALDIETVKYDIQRILPFIGDGVKMHVYDE